MMLRCILCEYDTPKASGQTTDGLRSAFNRKKAWENHEFKRVKVAPGSVSLIDKAFYLVLMVMRVAVYTKVKERDCRVSLLSALASMVIVSYYRLVNPWHWQYSMNGPQHRLFLMDLRLIRMSQATSIKCVASRHISYPGA